MSPREQLVNPESQEAAIEVWRYLKSCAEVDKTYSRYKGIPEERIAAARERLQNAKDYDKDAFYVVVTEMFSLGAGSALVELVRRFVEHRTGLDLADPTDPVLEMIIPPEAVGGGNDE